MAQIHRTQFSIGQGLFSIVTSALRITLWYLCRGPVGKRTKRTRDVCPPSHALARTCSSGQGHASPDIFQLRESSSRCPVLWYEYECLGRRAVTSKSKRRGPST
ncbi:predicted protein [Coccidioides posadasii str. Silveira]|uniref:Predicted protein n=1 Tax=Coccidioides posadasii (strain RMSCC 757 / Silveira) TaxID=443226 RepID=E9DEL4_COCPS|nr:predicted protein [Coccidioides posadasii str. Silveira]